VAIQCPACQHALGLRGAKPGRYATRCPQCSERLTLVVSNDPGIDPVITLTAQGGGAPTAAALTNIPGPTLPGPDAPPPPQPTTVSAGLETQPRLPTPTNEPVADEPAKPSFWGAPSTLPGETGQTAAPQNSLGGNPPPTIERISITSPGAMEVSSLSTQPQTKKVPTFLGGYQVLRELGRGAMGSVYLARQISLNRLVALKVMKPEWASNPRFVARFSREAFAAAQLTHPNIVPIHDFGQDRGFHYFSMEYVQGQSLGQLLEKEKQLDPEAAVGLILQAARGLKYAHDQGMIHRDIKPENLLLDDRGVVKVADLGLVKSPSLAEAEEAREALTAVVRTPSRPNQATPITGDVTQVNVAIGTPSFMAPEQANDAATVDARADIYSLGCTLYHLVTGHPPFEGGSAVEIIAKHQNESAAPPETVAKRVPRMLSEIILKMIAKRPEDRYAYTGEVIQALEAFLGVPATGVFTPRAEHAKQVMESAEQFNAAPTARLRRNIIAGALITMGGLVLLTGLARLPILTAGFLGLGTMAALAYFLVAGVTRGTELFRKVQQLVLGSGPFEWLMLVVGLGLLAATLVVFHLVFAGIAFGIVALMFALAMHFAVDKKIAMERREAIVNAENLIKSMRLNGLDEETLKQFLCKYAGEDWEEFYESLFGYEAKLKARHLWGRDEKGRMRRRFGLWRDPIFRWIEAKQQQRRDRREHRLLQRFEEKGLEARGVNLLTARRQANRAATAMITIAGEIKQAERQPGAVHVERIAIAPALRDAAAHPERILDERETGLIRSESSDLIASLFGPGARFLAGALLLAGCLLWMHQNELLTQDKLDEATKAATQIGAKAQAAATEAVSSQDLTVLQEAQSELAKIDLPDLPDDTTPLHVSFLPAFLTKLFNSLSPGLAGLILLFSSLFRGARISRFAFPAAGIAWLGSSLVPALTPLYSAIAGLAVMAAGIVLGRTR